jgi:hypothetical protein
MARRELTSAEWGLLILLIGRIFLSAWMAMLLLGMFAGYMVMPGLAIGYWATMGIVAMVNLIFTKTKTS